MKKCARIPKAIMIAVAMTIAIAAVGLLTVSLSGVRTQAAPLDDQGTGSDPRIETCTVTADLPISDTHPGDGVAKTIYFNNKSSGVITATFGISGTPTLVFVSAAAFDELMGVQVSSLAQAFPASSYSSALSFSSSSAARASGISRFRRIDIECF